MTYSIPHKFRGSNIQCIGTTKDDNTTPLWLMIIGLHVYSTLFGNKARKGANKTLIVMYSTLMYFALLHIHVSARSMYVKLTSISKMGNDQSLSPSDCTVHYTTLLPCLKTNHWQKSFYMSCYIMFFTQE